MAPLATSALALGTLEVGDGAADLGRVDCDELPAVLSPRVEDLLGVVRQQWNGRVLPAGHFRPLGSPRRRTTAKAIPSGVRGARGTGNAGRGIGQPARRASSWRRSYSFSPPQMPCGSRTVSAYSRHSTSTGQLRQIAFAAVSRSSRTSLRSRWLGAKKSSDCGPLQAARYCQPMCRSHVEMPVRAACSAAVVVLMVVAMVVPSLPV